MKFDYFENGRGSAKVQFSSKAIDEMIYEFMEREGIPGMSLAIVQAPYIPRVVGYGVTDIESKKLVSNRTVWPIGHISQGFTAVAIMQLFEKDMLNLNDSISKYLKNIPNEWKDITIFQLLQHSSGIQDYMKDELYNLDRIYNVKELIELIADKKLSFIPGTKVEMSATNFLLLTEIVEITSGLSYREFVKKYQIEYLRLKETFFTEDLKNLKQEDLSLSNGLHELFKKDRDYINPAETTKGYKEIDGDYILRPNPIENNAAGRGFSDIWASAENISFWDIGLAGSILIYKPENRDLIYKSTKLSNGDVVPGMSGWSFYNHKGLMDIKGSIPGYSTFLSRFTDKSELVCVTLIANKEGIDLTELARKIAGGFDRNLAKIKNPEKFYTYESSFNFKETLKRVENEIEKLNIPIFAKFDHALNAKNVGLDLRESTVVVFGSPKAGTPLMQEDQTLALELPLKILVFEDAEGSVFIEFKRLEGLVEDYKIDNKKTIQNMNKLLEKITRKSANVYTSIK
ncbi:MAG: serine hydrolase [Cetobacterium sp.]|uniref:serine hydrolase n=1 Tax=Cetobacterium sp. TaxID=2071632 RepID=UPI002FC7355F